MLVAVKRAAGVQRQQAGRIFIETENVEVVEPSGLSGTCIVRLRSGTALTVEGTDEQVATGLNGGKVPPEVWPKPKAEPKAKEDPKAKDEGADGKSGTKSTK